MIRRALISVYDKTGVVELARGLIEAGVELLSTGGTASMLREAGLEVTLVETVTGAAEMMNGRVKTLHPAVHAGILADRDNPEHMRELDEAGIQPIDMVVVNLYPFEATVSRPDCSLAEAVEMIDIGGPCMLRAAAKNHRHVIVVPDPRRYDQILSAVRTSGTVNNALRTRLAVETFKRTSAYDTTVAEHLARLTGDEPATFPPEALAVRMSAPAALRCGENPHQKAALYRTVNGADCTNRWTIRTNGDRMSFNNHVDADAAYALTRELSLAGAAKGDPAAWSAADELQRQLANDADAAGRLPPYAAAFIKHTNPCGAAMANDPIEAYRKAYLGDPTAAMGGVLAMNYPVTAEVAEAVMDSLSRWGHDAGAGAFFVEVWVAPTFADDAVEVIQSRKKWGGNVRLVDAAGLADPDAATGVEFKRITGGVLAQSPDTVGLNEDAWQVASSRAPTDAELDDLRVAWLVCKHTKSNAITLARDGMILGTGAGQMSRVTACRTAVELAGRHLTATDAGSTPVAASDAFFPFADGPALLVDAGVTAIIQPGGSKRDDETIALCDEYGLSLVLTGTRHFRH
jgi:phosphoribosylaminoimidazolecarboxamide formyltransferase/IMP cyclohydrolase